MADGDRRDGMQRVRVGLTGLAVVLILLAVATAVFRTVESQSPGNGHAEAMKNEAAKTDEPLHDLGMAPGAADENASSAAGSTN